MKEIGGRLVVRALEDEGIEWTFGIPGTHNIELYDALAESDRVRPVLVTDEQSASFMADAVWRTSGRMACVNLVPGAGLTHALSGVAEAFMDCVPMLVLGCGIRGDVDRAFQLHAVDQEAMIRPVVKGTFQVTTAAQIHAAIRDACRLARAGAPGPVFVEIPADLYLFPGEVELPPRVPEAEAGVTHRAGLPGPSAEPHPELVERAAELLLAAERPLFYVGAGCADATDRVRAVAERLEAPVSTTFQGKGVFPETHPLWLWPGFGATAPPFVRDVAAGCDLTLAVGCRFSEVGTGSWAFDPGRLIHVDADPDVPGRNFPAEVAVTADARRFLDALLERLGEGGDPDEALRREIREGHEAVLEAWREDVGGERVDPVHLVQTAQAVFGPAAVFTTDSGNGTFLAMEALRLDAPGRFLAPIDYSCMGYSVPAAVGAALAAPATPVVAFAGDGAFLMTGLELLTAVTEGVGPVVLVLRDRELAQIAQFQSTAMNRKVSSEVGGYSVRGMAEGVGAAFLAADRDEDVEPTLREAAFLASEGRPVLVDVAVDYERRTWFTRGVVRANLARLPLRDRLRFVGRAALRRVTG